MSSRLPKNVIFDVGNVLLAWDPRALVRRFANPGAQEAIARHIFLHPDWLELDRGDLDEEHAVELFSGRLSLPHGDIRDLMLAAKVSLTPIPDSLALLDELHALGVSLYCITNMARGTFAFVRRRFAFWERFQGIVVSADVHLVKPDPRIYRHALRAFAIDASETLFLDDKDENVDGARAVGMEGLRFTNSDEVRARFAPPRARHA
jgi:putative hydrolase of the HAD superfamily